MMSVPDKLWEGRSERPEAGDPPAHVAIIMDGNGRWARAHHLSRLEGHRRGANAVRAAVEGAGELGVRYLTLYAFSSENWKRPVTEVDHLMGLLRIYIRNEIPELNARNIRVRFIGERDVLARDLIALITEAEEGTRDNTGMTLVLAVNYGGQREIVMAARRIAEDVSAGFIRPEEITEAAFSRYLETAGMPDPDLIIRTSGEMRLSNFLLWQSAYAELVFIDAFWPDFSKDCLKQAVDEFRRRDRRYGARDKP